VTSDQDDDDSRGEPPAAKAPWDQPDQLVTSQDLFGDLVDEAPAEAPAAAPQEAVRAPIRVRLSEPIADEKGMRLREAPSPPSPEQIALVLDAIDDGTSRPAGEAAPSELSKPDLPAEAASSPQAAVAREAEDLLARIGPAEQPPPVAAPEGPSLDGEAEALLGRIGPAPSEPGELGFVQEGLAASSGAEAPPVDSPGVQAALADEAHEWFKAAAEAAGLEAESEGLDLAAVAEEAIDSVTPPVRELPEDRGPRRRRLGPPLDAFGPYVLLERLASGGMAEVFRAKRAGVEGFEKVVAVKRILPHLSDNREFVTMFVDEAKMVAGLSHPNIVQIFDLGRIETSYYIAMEYVHGRDLRTIIKRARERGTPTPIPLALFVTGRVCLALESAHRKKDERGRPLLIVHRDVSPQNILVSFEGDVKLADFGIARAASKAPTTDRGALRGKLLYMSPEHAWGRPIDRRADLYSLGVVLYELLTDQKPLAADPARSVLDVVREARVIPPSSVNPEIPAAVERIVLRALAREPEDRYQHASEMMGEIDGVLRSPPSPSSADLGRFVSGLFEEWEREDAVPDESASPPQSADREESFDIEFDGASSESRGAAPAEPSPEEVVEEFFKRAGME
jgi:serine/threonine protein kinase